MTEHAILKEIQSGKISPLYLFFGSEEYLIEDTLNQAIEILVDPSSKDFNFNIYHAEVSSPSDILDTARTLPFMTKHRVIIIKRIDAAKQTFMENRQLLNYLESPYKETCIIFTAREIDQRKKFFKSISKTGKTVHFKKLKTSQTEKWIMERSKANGYRIDSSASEYLADAFNNNLKRINTELEKIFLYIGKKNQLIRIQFSWLQEILKSSLFLILPNQLGKRVLTILSVKWKICCPMALCLFRPSG